MPINHPTPRPYWQCECGHEEHVQPDDIAQLASGTLSRRPGCPVCHRPLLLMRDGQPAPEGSRCRFCGNTEELWEWMPGYEACPRCGMAAD